MKAVLLVARMEQVGGRNANSKVGRRVSAAVLAGGAWLCVAGLGAGVPGQAWPATALPLQEPSQQQRAKLGHSYGRLPLRFEANDGQIDSHVKFVSRGSGYTVFLTSDEAVIAAGLAVGSDDKARLLWNNDNGQAACWLVGHGSQAYGAGRIEANTAFGPYTGWTARGIACGGDNQLRVLWNRNDGASALWLVDANAQLAVNNTYGPYGDWSANALAAGPDNKMRVLWTRPNGTAAFWTVAPGDQSTGGGSLDSNLQFGPY